jgi:gliding motility-associated-like protein
MKYPIPRFLLFLQACLTTGIGFSQPNILWNSVTSTDPFYVSTGNISKCIKVTADGGYITCGTISFLKDNLDVNGNFRVEDAWVVKYSGAGVIEWKRNYGGSKSDNAYSIVNTADGGYLFVGNTFSNDGDVSGNHNNMYADVWVVKLSSNGTIQWQKCYGGTRDDAAMSVALTPDGGFIMSGLSQSVDGDVTGLHAAVPVYSDVWVLRLDNTGSLLWQKCLGGYKDDKANSIQITADGGAIICGATESNDGDVSGQHGFYDMWVVKLNPSGTIEWQRTLGGLHDDLANSITQTPDGGYILCGETSSNDSDFSTNHSGDNNIADIAVVKLDQAGNTEWKKCLGGTEFDIGYCIQNDPSSGYVLSGIVYSNNGDVTGNHSAARDAWIVKLGNPGIIEWQKCYGGSFDDIPYSITVPTSGNYIFTGYTSSYDGDVTNNLSIAGLQTWTVKLGGCESVSILEQPLDFSVTSGSPATFQIRVQGSSPILFQWYRNGQLIPGANTLTYTTPPTTLGDDGTLYSCLVTNCGGINSVTSKTAKLTVIPPAPCETNYFIKTYSDNKFSYLFDMVVTEQNDVIALAATNNYSDAVIYRIDHNGKKLWERSMTGINQQNVKHINATNDHHYLINGIDDQAPFLLKIDINGNIIWRKNYLKPLNNQNLNPGMHLMKQDQDGFIYLTSPYSDGIFSYGILFIKCDPNGNIVLSSFIKGTNFLNGLDIRDMVIKNGYTYIVGATKHEPTMKLNGLLVKINNSDGKYVWSKLYDYNGDKESFLQVFDYSTDRLCIYGQDDINGTPRSTIYLVDTAGKPALVSFFEYDMYMQLGAAAVDGSGNLLFSNYHISSPTQPRDLAMILVNPYQGVVWAKTYPLVSPWTLVDKVTFDKNGNIYCGGTLAEANNYHMFIGKFDKEGRTACTYNSLPTRYGTSATRVDSNVFTNDIRSFITEEGTNPPPSDYIQNTETFCEILSDCSEFKIKSRDSICGTRDVLKVRIIKKENCFIVPRFRFDSAYFEWAGLVSDTAFFTIKKEGVSTIYASLVNNCDTLWDTLKVHIFADRIPDLGSDTSICENNSFTLHAGKDYSRYLWQDGSKDSIFVLNAPGMYYVQTTNSCGNLYSDSILVSQVIPPHISIGPDREKCNRDTLQLHAPQGLIEYTWYNNYYISSLTAADVVVNPLVDTSYSFRAEWQKGCFAFDTVHIIVHHSPVVNLGVDTSICAGESLSLDAGNGFDSYQWSNGSTSQQIVVHTTGSYSVITRNPEGCISKDTLRVLSVWETPVVVLDKQNWLCDGDSRILDPGSFSSYLWQDGSINKTFVANKPGMYFVMVMDQHGCSASDTANIRSTVPRPGHFLPADTSICPYESLALKANGNFQRYAWSSGSSSPSISIQNSGLYWLDVTDEKGCKGRDTIFVQPKGCMSGVYVPNAFTPNGDGKNDVFRAMVFGNVKSFRLTIYNRWGEIVYETTDRSKGWNGTLRQTTQDTNVFAWTCQYQVEGEKEKVQKGTLVLIR